MILKCQKLIKFKERRILSKKNKSCQNHKKRLGWVPYDKPKEYLQMSLIHRFHRAEKINKKSIKLKNHSKILNSKIRYKSRSKKCLQNRILKSNNIWNDRSK